VTVNSKRLGVVAFILSFAVVPLAASGGDATPPTTMSADAATELHAAIDLLKTRHMNRNKVDWPAVTAKADAMIANARTAAEAYPAINYVIGELGERHTHLLPATIAKAVAAGPGASSPFSKLITQYSNLPTVQRATRGIVMLIVPQFQSTEERDRAYVAVLRDALMRAKVGGVCRYIVDLRGNTGGNDFPMINGVASLLGPTPYGYWDYGSRFKQPWIIPNRPYALQGQPADYASSAPPQPSASVAVLINRLTWSAGEDTAIAFEGRPHTRIFGEPSGGFVTGNAAFPLPDGALLAISTAWAMDRLGRPYRVAVVPDQETGPGRPTIDAAIAWLNKQPCRTK
jgi:carboxyl-terminal processing protease